MSKLNSLPIILVSAVNENIANEIIAELIDNDVTEQFAECSTSGDRVWRLVNKYYTADVSVRALGDSTPGAELPDPALIDAHVVYVDEDETAAPDGGAGAAETRGARVGWAHSHVRVLACAGERAAPALLAAATAARAECVERGAPCDPAPPPGPFAENRGWESARAALHAHAWRGLRRTNRTSPPRRGSTESSSGNVSASDEDDADEERAVERAEAFAAALGALGAAPPSARRDNAEDLLAAFCHALGLPPLDC